MPIMDNCSHFETENLKEMRARCMLLLKEKNMQTFTCSYCESTFMVHICLHCGKSSCFKDGHFRLHHNESNHKFAINLQKQIIFCYQCNKYVQLSHFKDIDTLIYSTDPCKLSITEDTITYIPNSYILNMLPEKVYKKYPCTILKGTINLGNTCYLNALLNVLLYSQPFKDYFLNLKHTKFICKYKLCIICDIYDIYKDLYSKSECVILSNLIYTLVKKNKEFLGNKQYDVHELYIKLLNYISEVDSCLSNIFNGKNIIVSKCNNCGKSVEISENFFNICLSIEEDIQSAVDKFYSDETIDGFYCDICKSTGECNKRYTLSEHPEMLVLQQKRFEYKDNKIVKMGNNALLNNQIVIDGVRYQFYGTVVHDGVATNGHYRAYILIDGKYMCFNDEIITVVSAEEAINNVSYLSFYCKQSK